MGLRTKLVTGTEDLFHVISVILSPMIGCVVLIKENMGDLQENLRNVEDKLSAAETCKMMLNEEVLALRQAYDKLSSDLEVSQPRISQCYSQL